MSVGKDKGLAKLKNRKLIYGIGVNDFKISTIGENGRGIPEYVMWKSMFTGCYCEKYHKKQPTYKDCKVDEYFHKFTNFYDYLHGMIGFNELDAKGKVFQLDKDIINNKSKIYSRDTICLVPREINNLFIYSDSIRGKYPLGVHKDNRYSTYQAILAINRKQTYLGSYKTIEEAFTIYKNAKKQRALFLAEKWKNKIDNRVYIALINYDIKITD